MNIETLGKANNIIEKLERIESILEMLGKVKVASTCCQKGKEIEPEDLKTTLVLKDKNKPQNENSGIDIFEITCTQEHIEIMKNAFKERKDYLNRQFEML